MTAVIPDKRFFRIAEVSRIVGVPTHVLRYWEREFSVVRPLRTPSNQRLYRRDVTMAAQHASSLGGHWEERVPRSAHERSVALKAASTSPVTRVWTSFTSSSVRLRSGDL